MRPLAELAGGLPEPSPVGRTLGGARTGPAIPAPLPIGQPNQGGAVLDAMRQALAAAIAKRGRR